MLRPRDKNVCCCFVRLSCWLVGGVRLVRHQVDIPLYQLHFYLGGRLLGSRCCISPFVALDCDLYPIFLSDIQIIQRNRTRRGRLAADELFFTFDSLIDSTVDVVNAALFAVCRDTQFNSAALLQSKVSIAATCADSNSLRLRGVSLCLGLDRKRLICGCAEQGVAAVTGGSRFYICINNADDRTRNCCSYRLHSQ